MSAAPEGGGLGIALDGDVEFSPGTGRWRLFPQASTLSIAGRTLLDVHLFVREDDGELRTAKGWWALGEGEVPLRFLGGLFDPGANTAESLMSLGFSPNEVAGGVYGDEVRLPPELDLSEAGTPQWLGPRPSPGRKYGSKS